MIQPEHSVILTYQLAFLTAVPVDEILAIVPAVADENILTVFHFISHGKTCQCIHLFSIVMTVVTWMKRIGHIFNYM